MYKNELTLHPILTLTAANMIIMYAIRQFHILLKDDENVHINNSLPHKREDGFAIGAYCHVGI